MNPLFEAMIAGFVVLGTAAFWIERLPLVRKVRKAAAKFDRESVTITEGEKISDLRKRRDYGDKIVVAHYLVRRIDDVADTMTGTFWAALFAVAFVTLLQLLRKSDNQLLAASSGTESWGQFFAAIASDALLPVLDLGFIFYVLCALVHFYGSIKQFKGLI